MNPNNSQPNGVPGNESAVGAGARPPRTPTESEKAGFEDAMQEARQRFIAAALAEDGMPVSAGWRGDTAQNATPQDGKKFLMIPVPVELEAEVRELIARKHSA